MYEKIDFTELKNLLNEGKEKEAIEWISQNESYDLHRYMERIKDEERKQTEGRMFYSAILSVFFSIIFVYTYRFDVVKTWHGSFSDMAFSFFGGQFFADLTIIILFMLAFVSSYYMTGFISAGERYNATFKIAPFIIIILLAFTFKTIQYFRVGDYAATGLVIVSVICLLFGGIVERTKQRKNEK